MKVVQIASEAAPFSKSGGLADVLHGLGRALVDAGEEVWTISPRYRGVAPEAPAVDTVRVTLAGQEHTVTLHRVDHQGIRHLFVDNPMFDREGLYGDQHGSFGDNHLRFALLCQAALHATRRQIDPAGEVVFHCHDWQAALVPIYLAAHWRPVGLFERAATVLTLHNPAHQGRFPAALFDDLELSARWLSSWALEFYGDLALLKGGIQHADQITTVSPTFAEEIVRPGGGFGLSELFAARRADLAGILNGIDEDEWNPAADPHLEAPIVAGTLAGKARNKAAIQAELGLPIDPNAPLLGAIGRIDPQKGMDLLIESAPWLAKQGAQLVVLGTAAAAHAFYEDRLRALEAAYPRHVRAWIGYSDAVAHRIQGGADLFLMPSLFEPCGLTQMYAQRYGTPPVVRRTGGLADSVAPEAGFVFDAPTGQQLRDTLWQAIRLFREDRTAFDAMRRAGMARDFSWRGAAEQTRSVYRRAMQRRAG